MVKAKITGVSYFSYDEKDKKTNTLTGKRVTLGKVYLTDIVDVSDKNLTGKLSMELVVPYESLDQYKVGETANIVKVHGYWGI